jgi:hypothetical protein
VATPALHPSRGQLNTPGITLWLHWPEARRCVQVPYALLSVSGGGSKHGYAPTYHPLRPGSARETEAVPQARGSLGWSPPPPTPRQDDGRLALSALSKGIWHRCEGVIPQACSEGARTV